MSKGLLTVRLNSYLAILVVTIVGSLASFFLTHTAALTANFVDAITRDAHAAI